MDKKLIIGGVAVVLVFVVLAFWGKGKKAQPVAKQTTTYSIEKAPSSVKAQPVQQQSKKSVSTSKKTSAAVLKK